jgi:valyl-tRNA synthetase
MEKTYTPQSIEQQWYQFWESNHYFAPSDNGVPYCIMLPPPNVTGTLHMGHAFQHTLMDILIRYHRMNGKNTLWQPGTDHAGIATQMVVERQLIGEGSNRLDMGREEFVKRIWSWKEHSGGTITRQLRRMGTSMDWERERFTMDEGLSKAVTEVFIRLYDEGIIYRGKRLVNWDPVLHTAVSDLEVKSEEENGHLWSIRYPIVDSNEYIVVATTRPETLLGDSAVAVNPDDERYRHLIGKQARLPLTDRVIPIIADTYVDPEFGTGCVKITPAHDFNDYQVGKRHQLEMINIFTIDARINENGPEAYRGMKRFDARKQIVEDLKSEGLLESIKEHKLMVPRGDRSDSVIEPYLTDQWYVKTAPLAKPAIDAVKEGKIRFVPQNWEKTYFEWMNNIEDWCISRQIWWGHRIPAWYDDHGNVFVGRSEEEIRKRYQLDPDTPIKQDEDVLDTWFSSALWPFSTLGWPEQTNSLKTWYPTSVLVTGFDIIFFWVARMIMMGMKFMDGEVPFKEVYIHGLVRDHLGQKMSKSKGNVLDPIDLIDGIALEDLLKKRTTGLMQPQMAPMIEKATTDEFPQGIAAHGTDALRFTFAALASTGRDIIFDVGRIGGYRNFCNKLWNATRFVISNTETHAPCRYNDTDIELSLTDRWILSLLQRTVDKMNQHITTYRFDLAAQAIYDFTWNEYCDWYLELVKPVLFNETDEKRLNGTRQTLVSVLNTVIKLLHPFMPFITEEIWQKLKPVAGDVGETIMLKPYPVPNTNLLDSDAESAVEWLQHFLSGIRKIRGEMGIEPGKQIPVLLAEGQEADKLRAESFEIAIKKLGKCASIDWLDSGQPEPEAALTLLGDLRILVPMKGLIDKEAELTRLTRETTKAQIELEKLRHKLEQTGFADKAPPAVVQKEKARLTELENSLQSLNEQRVKIESL